MATPVGEILAERVCPDCLGLQWDGYACPECGYIDGAEVADANALEPGTIVGGNYVLGLVLGYPGGFGITYRGRNLHDGSKVAIKEYLPSQLAGRSRRGCSIRPLGEKHAQYFQHGLMRFRGESEILSSLGHPAIVEVTEFFEENDTAYLVMPYVEGITLAEYVYRSGGKIQFNLALNIMSPVMDALRVAHRRNLIHRDVSPENIYITVDQHVILLDFGAARSPLPGLELTCIVKLGFSPPEVIRGQRQGPFTDVYGVAATLYTITTGEEPPYAIDRENGDRLIPPSQSGIHIGAAAESALIKALALRASDRPQSIDEFLDAISTPPLVSTTVHNASANAPVRPAVKAGNSNTSLTGAGHSQPQAPRKESFNYWIILGTAIAVVVIVVAWLSN